MLLLDHECTCVQRRHNKKHARTGRVSLDSCSQCDANADIHRKAGTHHVALRAALVAVHRLEGVLVVQTGLDAKHKDTVKNRERTSQEQRTRQPSDAKWKRAGNRNAKQTKSEHDQDRRMRAVT